MHIQAVCLCLIKSKYTYGSNISCHALCDTFHWEFHREPYKNNILTTLWWEDLHMPRELQVVYYAGIPWADTQRQHIPRIHDDVIKWKHFPRHWLFVRGIHWSTVNSQHQVQWRGALMFSLIFACTNGWVHNREVGYLRRHLAQYDVIVMLCKTFVFVVIWH